MNRRRVIVVFFLMAISAKAVAQIAIPDTIKAPHLTQEGIMQTEQKVEEFRFFHRGKTYVMTLPSVPNAQSTDRSIDGTFNGFVFEKGQGIGIFVGGNMLLPLLKDKKYKVTSEKRFDGGYTRKGCNKQDGRLWQEVSLEENMIVIYFQNVKKDDLSTFENALNSLRVEGEK